jgi:hypothetical protein
LTVASIIMSTSEAKDQVVAEKGAASQGEDTKNSNGLGPAEQDALIVAQKDAIDKEIAESTPLVGDQEDLAVLEKEFANDAVSGRLCNMRQLPD